MSTPHFSDTTLCSESVKAVAATFEGCGGCDESSKAFKLRDDDGDLELVLLFRVINADLCSLLTGLGLVMLVTVGLTFSAFEDDGCTWPLEDVVSGFIFRTASHSDL